MFPNHCLGCKYIDIKKIKAFIRKMCEFLNCKNMENFESFPLDDMYYKHKQLPLFSKE